MVVRLVIASPPRNRGDVYQLRTFQILHSLTAQLGTMLQTIRQTGDFSPSLEPSRHFSIFSLTNTLTRLLSGFLSDYLSNREQPISRIPLFLSLALLQTLAVFILAYAPISWIRNYFSLGTALLGLGYGGIFTL